MQQAEMTQEDGRHKEGPGASGARFVTHPCPQTHMPRTLQSKCMFCLYRRDHTSESTTRISGAKMTTYLGPGIAGSYFPKNNDFGTSRGRLGELLGPPESQRSS